MRTHALLLGCGLILLAGVLGGGCTTGSGGAAGGPAGVSQDPGDAAFHYRQQAAQLRSLADRLEFEAAWYATQAGPDSEQAARSRSMAKDMRAAAEAADARAREYRQQLPHNRVY